MSSCARAAAGYLCHRGQIEGSDHAVDQAVRNEATRRRVELQERSHGKVCPHCLNRIAFDAYELHLLVAHQQVLQPEEQR